MRLLAQHSHHCFSPLTARSAPVFHLRADYFEKKGDCTTGRCSPTACARIDATVASVPSHCVGADGSIKTFEDGSAESAVCSASEIDREPPCDADTNS